LPAIRRIIAPIVNKECAMTLEHHYSRIIAELGEDVDREGLKRTPARAAKAMQYLCKGYQEDLDTLINGALFSSSNSEMVVVKNIELYSLCEHHLLPFIGKAHVAYLPTGKVLGVSKLARIVDCYAHRLHTQERLTGQIADFLMQNLKPQGVAVVLQASHSCMTIRGIKKPGSLMVTSALRGIFKKDARSRNEVLSLIHQGSV